MIPLDRSDNCPGLEGKIHHLSIRKVFRQGHPHTLVSTNPGKDIRITSLNTVMKFCQGSCSGRNSDINTNPFKELCGGSIAYSGYNSMLQAEVFGFSAAKAIK